MLSVFKQSVAGYHGRISGHYQSLVRLGSSRMATYLVAGAFIKKDKGINN
jgi:hypothetical protein